MTIMATLVGPIASDFQSLGSLSWLASAYLIANAAFQPLSGRLTDIFSRRWGLVFSNIFFAVGCLICGAAQNEGVMIAGRVIAGIGGGGVNAISTFVASDLVPLRQRGLWQGFGNLVFGFGMCLGGYVGGLINDSLGWRWAFWIQVPFIAVSGILVGILIDIPVKDTREAAWKRVDYTGAVLLTAFLVLFLYGVNSGGNTLPWTHPLVLTALPLSILFLLFFIYAEDRLTREPIIPVRAFLHRTVAAACATNIFATMATYINFFYVPLFLQVGGLTAEQAGQRLIPLAIAVALGSIGSGLTMRRTGRYYLLGCAAMALFIFGAALMSTLSFKSPSWETFVFLLPGGFGYGAMLTITLVALIAAVEHKDQAVITSASYAFRSTGSTTGIAIGSAVFQNQLGSALRKVFAGIPDGYKIVGRIKADYHVIEELARPELRSGALDAYMMAFRATFVTGLGLAVLAAVTNLFMREHKLYANLARK